jgi:uncharacterized protein YcgL (UPF0745 family)
MGVFDILALLNLLLIAAHSIRYSEEYQACYSHWYIEASNHPLIQSKNMFCVIYRSTKRDQTYLYVEKRDDFSRVPEELMKGFGAPQLAMLLPLDGRKKLVNADLDKVKTALKEQGYYLQLPPPPENLLKQHLERDGKK